MTCELIEICSFFNDYLADMPDASERMKKQYCGWNHVKCARFKVAKVLGREKVPHNMFPGDSCIADNILIQNGRK